MTLGIILLDQYRCKVLICVIERKRNLSKRDRISSMCKQMHTKVCLMAACIIMNGHAQKLPCWRVSGPHLANV